MNDYKKWVNEKKLILVKTGRIQFAPTPNGKFIRFIAIDNESDIIITRNKKDFKNSKIPVITAGEYIRR